MYLVKARSEDHVVSQQLCFSVITDNFEEIVHIFLASFFFNSEDAYVCFEVATRFCIYVVSRFALFCLLLFVL